MRKMKYLLFIATISATLGFCSCGNAKSSNTQQAASGSAAVTAKSDNDKKVSFTLPDLDKSLASVESSYTPENKNEPQYKSNIKYDDQGRVTSFSVLLDKYHNKKIVDAEKVQGKYVIALSYDEREDPFKITQDLWKKGLEPVVSAVHKTAGESSQPIAERATVTYKSATGSDVKNITFEIFTTKSDDVAEKIVLTNN
ncbi:MAG: hypothetical protein DUD27_07300 [Lachnospiraceae bacterium]|uniref:DUF5067 domain-containing protein n=1 Tax=Candidatus Weimeria bifida TaxID=2599074 RepID=A0A6N7IYE4_9FIRM|nr:hypothetical protein [Candidatus Weimeria bifida]RRF95784.1 MAG: hypothetical protein DUD27_07300 [Lachnospiraceae bacterium]